jgi:hypothetical protein
MAAKSKRIIAMCATVEITAQAAEGEKKSPAKFNVLAYTGGILPGALRSGDEREDVILDLAGMKSGKSLIANLDHETPQRVGHVNAIGNDGKQLHLAGTASASTAARDEVVNSAADGFVWQASVEADPTRLELVKPGATVEVNGQKFTAPPRGGRALYVARESVLKGFAFVSHGADDNTTVSIAASAASDKEHDMDPKIQAWAESMGIDVANATEDQKATIVANYAGQNGKKAATIEGSTPSERRKVEAKRRTEINDIADQWMAKREGDLKWVEGIEEMRDHAIEAKQSVQDFRNDLYESMVPMAHSVPAPRNRDRGLNEKIITAAICEAGRLEHLDKHFSDQELQAAHDRFPHGISLGEMFIVAAEANGFRGISGGRVTQEIHNHALRMDGPNRRIQAGGGFSTIDVANIVAATANKFLHEGWMHVDQTPLRIARIKPVRNFHTHTTVSLTGALQYTEVGAAGEIKHGTLDDMTYTNQAGTYASMLAITRKDIINDDLGALTNVPKRLGRGGALLLNHIFWTEFLRGVTDSFFSSGNSNINTGVADMSVGGLAATEAILMNQTDPDGKPVGFTPRIILVPPALKAAAMALCTSQGTVLITGASATLPNVNVFAGRFVVESSPYISNSSYTGATSTAWWMLADPNDEAVIEIAALNGRVEPTVDTAEANFNTLGVQMRGYCDVGVNFQEYRAGVHADGGQS